jgi:hypothetical protein
MSKSTILLSGASSFFIDEYIFSVIVAVFNPLLQDRKEIKMIVKKSFIIFIQKIF